MMGEYASKIKKDIQQLKKEPKIKNKHILLLSTKKGRKEAREK